MSPNNTASRYMLGERISTANDTTFARIPPHASCFRPNVSLAPRETYLQVLSAKFIKATSQPDTGFANWLPENFETTVLPDPIVDHSKLSRCKGLLTSQDYGFRWFFSRNYLALLLLSKPLFLTLLQQNPLETPALLKQHSFDFLLPLK